MIWLERAERIRTQQRHDKNKVYALHAPEVECIGKGKARKPYEFGVKSAVVASHKHGLMLGAHTFPGKPCDGHILSAVLDQATNLIQDHAVKPEQIVVDLGFRGVDADNPGKQIIHRGRYKTLTPQQKGWLRRRQAVERAIGHLKSDHRMDRCWRRAHSATRRIRSAVPRATTCAGCCAQSSVWPWGSHFCLHLLQLMFWPAAGPTSFTGRARPHTPALGCRPRHRSNSAPAAASDRFSGYGETKRNSAGRTK
jgi:hypothetical protein